VFAAPDIGAAARAYAALFGQHENERRRPA
jgi:hypothetical protein